MSKFKAPTETTENAGEMYFRWYLDELKAHGYIKDYSREPETFQVLEDYKFKKEKQYKTKPNVLEDFTLLQGVYYTYDFRIIWDESALFIFTEVMADYFKFGTPEFISHYLEVDGELEIVSYVDVKPPAGVLQFSGNIRSAHVFPFIQKFILQKYDLFINKIVPANSGKHSINTNLFAKTFTPNRYEFTDGGGQSRKIPFKKKSISVFTKRRRQEVDSILEMERGKNSQQSLL